MPSVRTPSKNSKQYLPKQMYLAAMHLMKSVPELYDELEALSGSPSSPILSGMPHGSGSSDTTANVAIKRATLEKRIDLVEACIRQDCPEYIRPYIYTYLTEDGTTYQDMERRFGLLPFSQITLYRYARKVTISVAYKM